MPLGGASHKTAKVPFYYFRFFSYKVTDLFDKAIGNYHYSFIAICSGIKIKIQTGRYLLYERVWYYFARIYRIYHVIRIISTDYGCTKTRSRIEIDWFVLIALRTAAEGPHSVGPRKADTASLLLSLLGEVLFTKSCRWRLHRLIDGGETSTPWAAPVRISSALA